MDPIGAQNDLRPEAITVARRMPREIPSVLLESHCILSWRTTLLSRHDRLPMLTADTASRPALTSTKIIAAAAATSRPEHLPDSFRLTTRLAFLCGSRLLSDRPGRVWHTARETIITYGGRPSCVCLCACCITSWRRRSTSLQRRM